MLSVDIFSVKNKPLQKGILNQLFDILIFYNKNIRFDLWHNSIDYLRKFTLNNFFMKYINIFRIY